MVSQSCPSKFVPVFARRHAPRIQGPSGLLTGLSTGARGAHYLASGRPLDCRAKAVTAGRSTTGRYQQPAIRQGATCRSKAHLPTVPCAPLEVFGSAARGDFDPARSDVDFVVEFERDLPVKALDTYFGLKDALETRVRPAGRSRHVRSHRKPLSPAQHRAASRDRLGGVSLARSSGTRSGPPKRSPISRTTRPAKRSRRIYC